MRYVIGILLILGGLAGGAASIKSLLWQQRVMTAFVAVPITVQSARVDISRSKNSTSYSPVILYSYDYQGRTYPSHQVFPYDYSTSSRSWAEAIVARYRPGPFVLEPDARRAKLVAYIDPENPSDAVLIREYFYIPFAFAMLSFYVALCGVGLLATDAFVGAREKMSAVALDDSGWQLLLPRQNLKRRTRNALIWLVGELLIVMPITGYWLLTARQFTWGFIIATCIALVFVVCVAAAFVRRWSVSRQVSDARLSVRPVPYTRGMPLSMEMEADAFSPLNVEGALARVVCTEHYKERRGNKTSMGTRVHRKEEVVLCAACSVAEGQAVEGKGDLLMQPTEWPGTTDISKGKTYPYYTYELRVVIKLRGMVDYEGIFPLEVG